MQCTLLILLTIRSHHGLYGNSPGNSPGAAAPIALCPSSSLLDHTLAVRAAL